PCRPARIRQAGSRQQPRSIRTIRRARQRAEGRAMSRSSMPRRRLRIGRLDLEMRGVDATQAEAAARALGPALAHAITSRGSLGADRERTAAGRVAMPASSASGDLAAVIARRIAAVLEGKKR